MKNTILLLLLCSSLFANAQITLEGQLSATGIHKIDNDIWFTKKDGGTLTIYRPDRTVYKTIAIPSQSGFTMEETGLTNLSRNLFNSNGKIVYGIACYNANADYKLAYYTEDNLQLMQQIGAYSSFAYQTSTGAKLVCFGTNNMWIYSLPGTVSLADQEPAGKLQALPFPNPVGDYINLPRAGLNIYNALGQWELKGESQVVDVRILLPGVYYYEGGSFVKQ